MTDDETFDSENEAAVGESYTRVDNGILDSSLWIERDHRSVFLTMLFMAKPKQIRTPTPAVDVRTGTPIGWDVPPGWYGFVRASSVGIIDRDKIPDREAGFRALEALAAPDPDSRSLAYEGRRIARVDGGYVILNFFVYRDRDYTAASRMRKHRKRKKAEVELFDLPEDVTGERNALRNVTDAGAGTGTAADTELQPQKTAGALVPLRNGQAKPLPAIHGKRDVVTIRERIATVLAEIDDGSRQGFERDQIRTLQAEMVFAYWQVKYRKPRAQLDSRREALIKKRLVENGGDVSEMFYALDGAMKDDWVMGRSSNSDGAHDGIEHILRNRANVERYANKCRGYRDSAEHPTTIKYAQIFANPSGETKQIESEGQT